MTTRKPKLNLLYADSSLPRLQLAVVQTGPNPSQQHARRWQSVRSAGTAQPVELPAPPLRTHH
jgi:hypothetical protein